MHSIYHKQFFYITAVFFFFFNWKVLWKTWKKIFEQMKLLSSMTMELSELMSYNQRKLIQL